MREMKMSYGIFDGMEIYYAGRVPLPANQNYDNGNQNDNNKNNNNNVRAVRGFTQDKRNVTVKLTGENVPRKEFFPVFWQEEPFQILFSHLGNLDLFLFTI